MRRFYTEVGVTDGAEGFSVTLDDKPIKTPIKNALFMPTKALAEAVANEWRAQEDSIVPSSMPMTRLVNSVLDRVAPRRAEIIMELVAYGHTDLVCYRADEPDELVALQGQTWNPYLDWLEAELGVDLVTTTGVLPIVQSDAAVARLMAELENLDDFALTAFHAFVAGFGSIVLALAAVRGFSSFDECWQASVLDQTFQEQKWGSDPEVVENRERLKQDLMTSVDLWRFTKS